MGVSFALERGKVLALPGESGSGKSVTMCALVRLLPAVRTRIVGEITRKGQALTALSAAEMHNLRGSRIAMVFQEPMTALDPVYTVGQQIGETLMRHQQMPRAQARQRALGSKYRRRMAWRVCSRPAFRLSCAPIRTTGPTAQPHPAAVE